jgi:hypothetical protein
MSACSSRHSRRSEEASADRWIIDARNCLPARSGTCCRMRLDWLVKSPAWLLMDLMEHGECPWRLLAIRAGYVKLGVLGKY